MPSPMAIVRCADCVKLLGEYVDGSMPKDEAAALEEHLSRCMPCITFLRTYKATRSLCRSKMAKEMPEELKSSLSSFLAARVPGFSPTAAPATASAKADLPETLASAPLKKS